MVGAPPSSPEPGPLYRLTATGFVDPGYKPDGGLAPHLNPPATPIDVEPLPGGRLAGSWYYPGQLRPDEARSVLFIGEPDGTRSRLMFVQGGSLLAGDPQGGVLIANTYDTSDSPSGTYNSARLFRVAASGGLDTNFTAPAAVAELLRSGLPGYGGFTIYSFEVDAQGRFLIGGLFGRRLRPDAFEYEPQHLLRFNLRNPEEVTAVAVPGMGTSRVRRALPLPDGRTVVLGKDRGLVRLLPDLQPDPAFQPPPFGRYVHTIAAGADGRVFVAYESASADATRLQVVRLAADGQIDLHCGPAIEIAGGWGSPPAVMAVQPDGNLLVAGSFTHVDGVPMNGMVRLVVGEEPASSPRFFLPAPRFLVSESAGAARIPVRCAGELTQPTTVRYRLRSGEALAGRDFVGGEGQVEFLPGDRVKEVTVTLLPDADTEWDETFHFTLTSTEPDALLGESAEAQVTIPYNGFEENRLVIHRRGPGFEFLWMTRHRETRLEARTNMSDAAGPVVAPDAVVALDTWFLQYYCRAVIANETPQRFFRVIAPP